MTRNIHEMTTNLNQRTLHTPLEEQWAPLPQYEGLYIVNRLGTVVSTKKSNRGYVMEHRIDRAGYDTVKLTNREGKGSTRFVHRIIAEAFLPNPLNKPWINHIDGNKLNNHINNLEWVTPSENWRHALEKGLCAIPFTPKRVKDNCSGKTYRSIKKAARENCIAYDECKAYLYGDVPNPTCLELVKEDVSF